MSQQRLGLRRLLQIMRRHKLPVGIMVALGLLLGGGYAAFNPALVSSTALVLLPQSGTSAAAGANVTGVNPYLETQEVIAKSVPVFLGALPHVRPVTSLNKLRLAVEIGSESTDIISVSAKEKTAADAAATANAVASSYISYTGSESTPGGRVQAQLLQPAPNNSELGRVTQLLNYATYALLGALVGAFIGIVVAVAVNRRDRRLRKRDDIANSIGVPVLASFPVGHPSSAGKWTSLLEDYKPGALYALQLRNAIKHLEMAAADASPGGENGRWSCTVLSLSSDPRALGLGPQLAVFAASQGIPTALVIGPQQDAKATATLRAACAASSASSGSSGSSASSEGPGHLQLIVSDSGTEVPRDVTLAVVVAVVDDRSPQVPATMRTSATLLGVSAGAATADQLARVAISAVSGGREITGILVADPDSDDPTAGRLPQPVQHAVPRGQRAMPTRVTRIATEIRR
jgi:capsular polysaccharide biosynthesis protein